MCRRDAGFRLIAGDAVPDHSVIARLGVAALDGTKINANAALAANRTAGSLAEEVAAMFAEADAVDPDSGITKTRRGRVQGDNGQAVGTAEQIIVAAELASQANDERQLAPMLGQAHANAWTASCGPNPVAPSTGCALYRLRGQTVEPVFGQVKEQQGADRFMMRGIEACRGEWKLHAAAHNLRKLHRKSVQKAENATKRAIA